MQRRQRIIFLVSSMGGGGAERVAALLSNYWASQGHSVTLVPTFSGRGTCDYPLDDRVTLLYLSDEAGVVGRGMFRRMKRLFALRRTIKAAVPDRVISFLTGVNVAAILATRWLGVPVIVSERIYPPTAPLSPLGELIRRSTYPLANYVVMQTSEGLRWLTRTYPRAKGVVIPNPLVLPLPHGNPEVLPNISINDQRRVLLGVGRLTHQKQFSLLLDVFARMASGYPSWDLVILGEGEERQSLEARVRDFGLQRRVFMPGRVGNLGDWYKRADAFVLASRSEGFPNALLEAIAHGLPVVSFDCDTGPRDLIVEGVNGYLVEPSAGAEGLEIALRKVLDGKQKPLLESAERVVAKFNIAQVGDAWLELEC